jgi:hypothetical protein
MATSAGPTTTGTPSDGAGRAAAASQTPCAACPWRTTNHGRPHPDGWYTATNRRRLWNRLRRGEAMSCHPTDPRNPVPAGHRPAPAHAVTRECTGALILQQRELLYFQDECGADLRAYRRRHPMGLLRDGLLTLVERALFSGTSIGGVTMTRPDLNQPVSHPPLGAWQPPSPKPR